MRGIGYLLAAICFVYTSILIAFMTSKMGGLEYIIAFIILSPIVPLILKIVKLNKELSKSKAFGLVLVWGSVVGIFIIFTFYCISIDPSVQSALNSVSFKKITDNYFTGGLITLSYLIIGSYLIWKDRAITKTQSSL